MGGAVLSGAHTVVGNVITITIAEVTGNVLIKVPTVNTATGEEEEPEVPDIPVVPDEPGTGGDDTSTVYTLTSSDIESGGWGLYDKMDNTGRLRVKELISLTAGTTITWEIPSSLKMTITILKADGSTTNLNQAIYRQLWATGNGSYTVAENAQMHLIWAKTNDSQPISVSDWSGTYTVDATNINTKPLITHTLTIDDVEVGGRGWYDTMDAANRLRTKELIEVPANTVITTDTPSNLKVCVTVVKLDNSSTTDNTCIVRKLWPAGKQTFTVNEAGYLHFVWKRSDEQNVTVGDWAGTYTYQTYEE